MGSGGIVSRGQHAWGEPKLRGSKRNGRRMTAPRRKREIFANPFFAILLLASVVFVFTVLGYLSSAWILDPKPGGPPPVPDRLRSQNGSIASALVAGWRDSS